VTFFYAQVVHLDVDAIARQLESIVVPMQERFSYKPGSYYNHALFFLSTAIHRVMPAAMHKVIMMDVDLRFRHDIKLLYDQFARFNDTNVIGIAREMQPVYRHLFWQHRRDNSNTRVGEPPPNGLTGFNSGVLLLDLDRMRESDLYNSMLTREKIEKLADDFHIKGHLGDQDFFTVVSMVHEELFYVLPCIFNRQLSTWWRDHGYKDVFDQYHKCDGDVVIYHGNGKSLIPDD
jgi:lipopolysaccharide biosynthesis glycosyltransferase